MTRGSPSSDYTGDLVTDDLAVTMGALARQLQDETNVQDTLDAITAAAVDTVPGADHAGLMVVRGRRRIETRAATDELVRQVDRVQYESGEGPCLDAVHLQLTVRLADTAAEPRWPVFAPGAAALGVASMLSLQLYVERDNLGALNLFSRTPDAFGNESEHVALLFAAHAAVAMSGAQRREQLTDAIAVRDLIGQAKGILMERYKITDSQAFSLLVRASQQTNTKLADVARHLAQTGELDD